MRHLLRKDLLLQKRMLGLVFLYATVLGFLFRNLGNRPFMVMISVLGYMLIMVSSIAEGRSDVLLNSLPVPKWKIVGPKYVVTLIYSGIIVAIWFLVSIASAFFGLSQAAVTVSFLNLLSNALIFVFQVCLYWPLYFFLGYIKSRYASFVVYFGFIFVTSSVDRLVSNGSGGVDSLLEGIGPTLMTTLLTGIGGLLVAISFGLSLYRYRRREF